MNELIKQQIEPLRSDAIKRANEYAKQIVKNVREDLKSHDGDINAAAPYPSGNNISRAEYAREVANYKLYQSLTKTDKSKPECYRHNTPRYVVICQNMRKKFILAAEEKAAFEFDAFIVKLSDKSKNANKEAEIVKAERVGNYIWNYGHLIVTYSDGSEIIWRTQNIFNISKLGKVFNQFPTRKVKK